MSRHEPERRCILSGEHGPREGLIRLALGPDGIVLPDVGARAPGRGAWLGVDRATLVTAQAKGKLRGALTRAFKTNEVSAPADLAQKIADALRKRALDRLGLEARSGNIILGSDRIGDAVRAGRILLLLHAADAAADGISKLDQRMRVAETGRVLHLPLSRTDLSMALGRENVVHAALGDRAAAGRVEAALDRWLAFTGTAEGSERPDRADPHEDAGAMPAPA